MTKMILSVSADDLRRWQDVLNIQRETLPESDLTQECFDSVGDFLVELQNATTTINAPECIVTVHEEAYISDPLQRLKSRIQFHTGVGHDHFLVECDDIDQRVIAEVILQATAEGYGVVSGGAIEDGGDGVLFFRKFTG